MDAKRTAASFGGNGPLLLSSIGLHLFRLLREQLQRRQGIPARRPPPASPLYKRRAPRKTGGPPISHRHRSPGIPRTSTQTHRSWRFRFFACASFALLSFTKICLRRAGPAAGRSADNALPGHPAETNRKAVQVHRVPYTAYIRRTHASTTPQLLGPKRRPEPALPKKIHCW